MTHCYKKHPLKTTIS